MNLFFQIQSFQLLIFPMNDLEFVTNLNFVLLCFLSKHHQSWLFLHCFIISLYLISSFSLTTSLIFPYAYISIESIDCILLWSFELKASLLTSSVKTLYFSLLNLWCVFIINLFFMNSLWSFLKLSTLILFFLDRFFIIKLSHF